jgi:predicted DNA-binding antitoxin AbrB/MazE fold protein
VCLDNIDQFQDDQRFTKLDRDHLCDLCDGADRPLSMVVTSQVPLRDLFPDDTHSSSPFADLCSAMDSRCAMITNQNQLRLMSTSLLAVIKNGKIEPLEPITFPEGTQLVVTLNITENDDDTAEKAEWQNFAQHGLSRAYDDDEPGYDLSQIQEFNPHYAGR